MKASNIFLIVFLYLYIYNPVFAWPGFGFVAIISVIAILYCITRPHTTLNYVKYYKAEFFLSVIITLYIFFITLLNNQNKDLTMQMCSWALLSFATPVFIIEAILSKVKSLSFFNLIINTGVIAAIISFLCMVFPMFNEFIRSIQSDVESKGFDFEVFRYYGLANNLTSAYGYVQGTLAALCILVWDTKKRYYLFFVLLTISAAINARTGLFPVIIALIYKFMSTLKSFKLKKVIQFVLIIICTFVLIKIFIYAFPNNTKFILDFFEQLENILITKEEESAYERMLFFPKETNVLIFGAGKDVIINYIGDSSDIGYVRQIFIGGLVFAISLIIYEYILYRKMWNRSDKFFFPVLLFTSALIFNYKGSPFYLGNAFTRLVYLYYFVLVYNTRFCEKGVGKSLSLLNPVGND